jgi:lipid II:glycine glycyltransferase (peptidoglycan interpeptide bridge formation enzyme)
MTLWYVQGDVAYYHLGAYSDRGYALRASFALFWQALELLQAERVRWLDLGAGPGLAADASNGLSRFKRGWATGTQTAYLCGRVFNRARYEQLLRARGRGAADYFPAYRARDSS